MKQRESGFTIIETTLVLAIAGLVISLTLLGIGNALNRQRYSDAVSQSVDFFRGQYVQASSTVNNRPLTENCTSAGITTSGPSVKRGASECMLLGKVMRSTGDGKVTVHQVLALSDPSGLTGVSGMTDSAVLALSNLEQGNLLETYEPDWGTRLLAPGSDSLASFTIMIVRAPVSGTVHTYNSSSAVTDVADLLASQSDTTLCIDQGGFFSIAVAPMGIKIVKDAGNPTGVRILSAGDCVA